MNPEPPSSPDATALEATYFAGDPRSNYQRMLAGDDYIGDDPRMLSEHHRAVQAADAFAAAYVQDPLAAQQRLKDFLGAVGEQVTIRPPISVDYGHRISIGDRCFINCGLVALDVAPISIGPDTLIGPGVQLLTPTHPLDPQARKDKLESARPISIGANVWIGGSAVICPGVSIGDNAVVGAGSVVTKDVPANTVVMGNPARARA